MLAWFKRAFKTEHEDDLIRDRREQEAAGYVDLSTFEKEPDNVIVDQSSDIGGIVGYGFMLGDTFNNVNELVKKYREMALYSDIDDAVDEVVNEAIIKTEDYIVDITLEDTELSESIKEDIYDEFWRLLDIMDWREKSAEIFRQWYIDGRLYSQNVFDYEDNAEGIIDLNILSPFNLTRIRNKEGKQYYVYKVDQNCGNEYTYMKRHYQFAQEYSGFIIPDDHINFVSSGISDPTCNYYISHLHKAIKPFNQLRMLEDSAVIYSFTRAPERRAFYVNTGKMNKSKSEEYMKGLMSRFKNRVVYDSNSGELTQQKNTMIINEDYWLPSTDEGKGTRIENIAGGTQLPDLVNNIEYFKKKLLKSLKVPYGRFDVVNGPGSINFSNDNKEIARDEMRFAKFVNGLRDRFARGFFLEILKKSLIRKGIIDLDEWMEIQNNIHFVWAKDQYYEDIARLERMKGKLELIGTISSHIGSKGYFSRGYVYREVLGMTEEDIRHMRKEIVFEEKMGEVSVTAGGEGGEDGFETGFSGGGIPSTGLGGGGDLPPLDAPEVGSAPAGGDVIAPGELSTGPEPAAGEEAPAEGEKTNNEEEPAKKEEKPKPQPKNPI